jgi:hypothetical protein
LFEHYQVNTELEALDQCDSPGLMVLIWPAVGVSYRKSALDRQTGRRRTQARPMLGKPTGQLLTGIFSHLKSGRRSRSEPQVPLGRK